MSTPGRVQMVLGRLDPVRMEALDWHRRLLLADTGDPTGYLGQVTGALTATGDLDPEAAAALPAPTPGVAQMVHQRYLIARHIAAALVAVSGVPPDTGPSVQWYLDQSCRRLDLVLESTFDRIAADDPVIPLLARSGTPLPQLAQRLCLPLWQVTIAVLLDLPDWRAV